MKQVFRIAVVAIWMVAIGVPNSIAFLDSENDLVVSNLNDEEQQETVKKSLDEEKIVHNDHLNFLFSGGLLKRIATGYHSSSYINHNLEILLPPPEQFG